MSPFRRHKQEHKQSKISDADAEKIGENTAREADKKGLTGRRRDAYIYGAKRRAGWVPKRER
jgi:hypothetical protein